MSNRDIRKTFAGNWRDPEDFAWDAPDPERRTGPAVKVCKPGHIPAGNVAGPAGGRIYCAARADLSRIVPQVQPRLVLDCTGVAKVERTVVVEPGAPRALRRIALRHAVDPAVLHIAWPDFGLPPVAPAFFVDLNAWLAGGTLLCVCMGGHGRSGTAAACILAARGVQPADAINAVRTRHCNHAIETKEQEAFVGRVYAARRKSSK